MVTQNHDVPAVVADLLLSDRNEQGLTVRQHARRLGVSESTYFRIQRGRIDKTTETLMRLLLKRIPCSDAA